MVNIHLASGSLNQTPLDWVGNLDHVNRVVREARIRGVDILCLPELCLTGYGCEDMFLARWVIEKAEELLFLVIEESRDIVVVCGLPIFHNGFCFNAAAVISNQKLAGIVPKQFLANDGIHYEPRWFKAFGGENSSVSLCGEVVPFGQVLFSFKGVKFGVEICEDAWVSARPASKYLKEGASIILNPSASHFEFGKAKRREETATSLGEISSEIVYVYSNLLGNEAGRAIYDGSSFISKGENVLARAPRFSFSDFTLLSMIFEFENKAQNSSDAILLSETSSDSITSPKPTGDLSSLFEKSANIREEEFTRSVSLGMFDYLRKTRSTGYVVSLSGGADSSACAVLSFLSIALAVRELGQNEVLKRINKDSNNSLDLSNLILLAYLKTKNNSLSTLSSARAVAEGIGVSLSEFEVDDLVSLYSDKISGSLSCELSWDNHSVPLQNIQARARGPLVWFLANLRGALLLATSNRSEAAVGYATMDGDTCGGLSPVAGVDKLFLMKWLKWLSDSGNHDFGDYSFLKSVTKLSPSAELKPPGDNQTDEGDLMPYEVLSVIDRGFVRDKLSRGSLIELVMSEVRNISHDDATCWVDRFLSLWRINQWKRERYAPSFHLDQHSLDPKTWCRFPILSGTLG
ncbi:MAG TPA: NAD(+) synthase [Oligoflexia bacterium]|nr:NAD(+) synthase [Oligoflexia bacterium]HMP49472.1 NAD(+) synthase [Oligoflexia bacterium]